MTPSNLNTRFGIPGELVFSEGTNAMFKAEITNALASATLYLHGAHLTSFCPKGYGELLWLSPNSYFEPPKAIRGGIPICWPWFGPHPHDTAKPQHGFARNRPWRVERGETLPDGATLIMLSLGDDKETLTQWPFAFRLELHVYVGRSLRLELHTRNTGDKPFELSSALHSYFKIGDIAQVSIEGLEGLEYADKTDAGRLKQQSGNVRFNGETDRIYRHDAAMCQIVDPVMKREIMIEKSGANATVVWNPGPEKAAAMSDFSDNGYREMLCCESAFTHFAPLRLEPGESHLLVQSITPQTLAR